MEAKKQKYAREELEERLADYAIGRLSLEEREIFEFSLEDYPEIKEEALRAKAVFATLERLDVKSVVRQRSRNLTAKTLARLEGKKSFRSRNSIFGKVLLPAASLAILIGFIFFADYAVKQSKIPATDDALSVLLADSLPDENALDALASVSAISSSKIDYLTGLSNSLIEPAIENFDISKNLLESNDPNSLIKGIEPYFDEYDLIDDLNDLTEEEAQEILKELENVKINA